MSIKFEPFAPPGFDSGVVAVRTGAMRMRASDLDRLGLLDLPALRVASTGVIKRRGAVVVRKPPLVMYAGRPNVVGMKLPMPRAYGRNVHIDVTFELAFVTIPAQQVHASGVIKRRGSALTVISPKRMFASDKSNVGMSVMPAARLLVYDLPPIERFAVLLQSPGYVTGTFGAGVPALATAAAEGEVSDSADSFLTIQAFDGARGSAALGSHLNGRSAAEDHGFVIDRADPIIWLIAEATAVAQDDPALFLRILLSAADLALATGAVASQLDAFVAVAAAAEAIDRADPIVFVDAESGGVVVDEAAARAIGIVAHAMATVAAEDAAASSLRMLVVATDSADATTEVASALQGLLAAFDAGSVVATIRIGTTVYAAYAMTIEGQLVSEYNDIAFNSQALHDGHLYVASDNGIFLMEGDDDAGTPINSSVRVGLTALGTQQRKHVPAVYIGYTSDGALLCKVSTTDKGVKRTNVYKINPIPRTVVGDGRFTPSKGLNAVYWDFELSNLDGADFELDTIKVWRMALGRRK